MVLVPCIDKGWDGLLWPAKFLASLYPFHNSPLSALAQSFVLSHFVASLGRCLAAVAFR